MKNKKIKKIRRVPAKKIANNIIKECDVILLVMDARNPEGTRNRTLEKKINESNKKLIYVLNKSDLVPMEMLKRYRENIKNENPNASIVFVSSKYRKGTKILRDIIKRYIHSKNIKEGKVGVLGYPNVGKSSLINSLTGKRSAISGLVAGLTKGEQWINLTKNIKLLDTPGIIEPRDEDELIILGALRYEKIENPIGPALKILKNIYSLDKDIINKQYNVDIKEASQINEEEGGLHILEKIGKELNYLKKGGTIDILRTAKTIIKDYQEGKLSPYNKEIKKYGQERGENIDIIAKYLDGFLFIHDANGIVSHLEDIEELKGLKIRRPIIGSKKIEDAIVIISLGEKTADSGRKKVEKYAKKNAINIYSTGKGRIGKNRIFVGVGETLKK
ncbi:50S ribosome-binding GTPase [Methanothermococcus sp. SCGC AD-155-M21]|nr:50S ribosome-binding GTPase [Methanothermococcus sp. SCGC AD-155-M21]